MDVIASARIPVETKRQGDAKLKSIGSNTTALINAAYEYLLKTGTLPSVKSTQADSGARTLSSEQKAGFQSFMEQTTLVRPESWGSKSYEELFDEAMSERYADYLN